MLIGLRVDDLHPVQELVPLEEAFGSLVQAIEDLVQDTLIVHAALFQPLQKLDPADAHLLRHDMRMQLVVDELVHAFDVSPLSRRVSARASRVYQLLLSHFLILLVPIIHRQL